MSLTHRLGLRPAALITCVLIATASTGPAQTGCGISTYGSYLFGDLTGTYPTMRDWVSYDDGSGPALYVCGWFPLAGVPPIPPGPTFPVNNIFKYSNGVVSALGSGLGSWDAQVLAVYDTGSGASLYVAGSFSTAGGNPASGIARWDGTSWHNLAGASVPGISDMIAHDDGSGPALYVTGGFTSINGIAVNGIAKWDGTSWAPVGTGAGVGGGTGATVLEVFDAGGGPELYLGGYFSSIDGTPANGLARWDGINWIPLPTGNAVQYSFRDLEVWCDSNGPGLFIAGEYGTWPVFNGVFVKWDGANFLPVAGAFPPIATCLEVFDDGTGTGPALFLCTLNQGVLKWDGTNLGVLPVNSDRIYAYNDGTQAFLETNWVFFPGPFPRRWTCGTGITVTAAQSGTPGGPIYLNHANLRPGITYFNAVSFDLCPGGVGTGPYLGLCYAPASLPFLFSLFQIPLGTPPIHYVATRNYHSWGPIYAPVGTTIDAVLAELVNGGLGQVSPTVRITF